jgi:hypothetical protein
MPTGEVILLVLFAICTVLVIVNWVFRRKLPK